MYTACSPVRLRDPDTFLLFCLFFVLFWFSFSLVFVVLYSVCQQLYLFCFDVVTFGGAEGGWALESSTGCLEVQCCFYLPFR